MLLNRIPFLYLCLTTYSPTKAFSIPQQILGKHNTLSSSRPLVATRMSSNNANIGLADIGSKTADESGDSNIDGITSWRDKINISMAKSRKVRGGNYVQIATVDRSTLEPRCRTVVFRGFLKGGDNEDIMKMITDKRSNKFAEITGSNSSSSTVVPDSNAANAEMVWWFSKSSEQYRIRGELKFVGNDEDDAFLLESRKQQWGNLSDMAREQFFWKDPGLPYESESVVPAGGRGEDGKVLPPPDSFLLMLLYPRKCDYLRLGDNYRQEDELSVGGSASAMQWQSKRVNP